MLLAVPVQNPADPSCNKAESVRRTTSTRSCLQDPVGELSLRCVVFPGMLHGPYPLSGEWPFL